MSWFYRPVATRSVELSLFCFPYAGAGPNIFRGWDRLLPTSIEASGAVLPGRAFRLDERPRDRLGPLADELVGVIRRLAAGPYAFFGHSFGGLLCFEVTRRLHRLGAPLPRHLFVSACPPPHLLAAESDVHGLPDRALKERLLRLGGTPLAVLECDELLNLFLPALRADLKAFETHHHEPGPPLPVPLTVLGGAGDRLARPETLEGWARYTRESFEVRVFPGGHFFLHSDEEAVVATVADILSG